MATVVLTSVPDVLAAAGPDYTDEAVARAGLQGARAQVLQTAALVEVPTSVGRSLVFLEVGTIDIEEAVWLLTQTRGYVDAATCKRRMQKSMKMQRIDALLRNAVSRRREASALLEAVHATGPAGALISQLNLRRATIRRRAAGELDQAARDYKARVHQIEANAAAAMPAVPALDAYFAQVETPSEVLFPVEYETYVDDWLAGTIDELTFRQRVRDRRGALLRQWCVTHLDNTVVTAATAQVAALPPVP